MLKNLLLPTVKLLRRAVGQHIIIQRIDELTDHITNIKSTLEILAEKRCDIPPGLATPTSQQTTSTPSRSQPANPDTNNDQTDLPQTFYGTPTKIISLNRPALDGSNPTPLKCTKYNYLTWKEMPSEKYIIDYYKNVYYPEARKTWYNVESNYNPAQWEPFVKAVLGAISKFGQPAARSRGVKALDIGCSFGGLVHALRQEGIEAYGVDLNPIPIEEGIAHGNTHIHGLSLRDFIDTTSIKPEIFVSNHTLEHFIDPFSFIEELRGHFDEESIGYFAFPNGNHYCSLIGNYTDYGFYAFPDHLHLFGPYSTFRLFMDRGFSILDIESVRDDNIAYLTEGTKRNLSPLNPDGIISYDAFQAALEANFAASALHVTFCKADSAIARRNGHQIQKMLALCEVFEKRGL